jgi:hypothetical protein
MFSGLARAPEILDTHGDVSSRLLFGLYLTLVFCLLVNRLDIYLADKGFLPMNILVFPVAAAGAFFWGVFSSPFSQVYLSRYLLIIKANTTVLIFFLLWILGHLMFLGKANLVVGDVDYTLIFPIYQLAILMFGLALPAMSGFDGALAIAVRAAILALGLSILIDIQMPGYFSDSVGRGAGFAENANIAAFVLCLNIAMMGIFLRMSLTDVLTIIFACLAVLCTFSRSGLAQLLIIVGVYAGVFVTRAICERQRGGLARIVFVLVALITAIGFLDQIVRTMPIFNIEGVAERLDRLQFWGNSSIVEDRYRPVLSAYYLGLVFEQPMLGYGTYYTAGSGIARAPFGLGPHNMYLRVWVEHGIWGLVTYLGIFVSAMWLVVRRRFVPGQLVVLLGTLYGFFSHNIMENKAFLIALGVVLGRSAIAGSMGPVTRANAGRRRKG